jgi:hypothetical protein
VVLELGAQSQNHVIRPFVHHRCCSEVPFAETASGGDLFTLPDVVELQRAVVASHVRRSVFRNRMFVVILARSQFCYTFWGMNRPSSCAIECELAHLANNKLSVIIGMCDRIFEQTNDPQVIAGLRVIHMAAQALADEFNKPLRRGQGA